MKIKRVQPGSESFVPVTFQVTIESFDELLALWHRLNAPMNVAYAHSNNAYPRGKDTYYPLFQWINMELHTYDTPELK